MPIDDRELRLTAADWLHQLRRTDPGSAGVADIKDTPNLALIVEVKITSAGSSRRPQRQFFRLYGSTIATTVRLVNPRQMEFAPWLLFCLPPY